MPLEPGGGPRQLDCKEDLSLGLAGVNWSIWVAGEGGDTRRTRSLPAMVLLGGKRSIDDRSQRSDTGTGGSESLRKI